MTKCTSPCTCKIRRFHFYLNTKLLINSLQNKFPLFWRSCLTEFRCKLFYSRTRSQQPHYTGNRDITLPRRCLHTLACLLPNRTKKSITLDMWYGVHFGLLLLGMVRCLGQRCCISVCSSCYKRRLRLFSAAAGWKVRGTLGAVIFYVSMMVVLAAVVCFPMYVALAALATLLLLLPINDAFKASSLDVGAIGSACWLNCLSRQMKCGKSTFPRVARTHQSSWNRDGHWKLIHWIWTSCTSHKVLSDGYRLSGATIKLRKI